MCFRDIYANDDLIFLVDKYFTCINSIRHIFALATVLSCIFHVIKFLRTLFATAFATVEKKDVIMLKLRSLIFACDEQAFKAANEDFLNETANVQVRINKNYRNLG